MTSDTQVAPPTDFFSRYEDVDIAQRKALVDLAIERYTSVFDAADLEVGCYGKRWPDWLPMAKFTSLLQRRGIADLYVITIYPIDRYDSFSLEITCTHPTTYEIHLTCDHEKWEEIGGRSFVASMLQLIPITIGFAIPLTSRPERMMRFYPIWPHVDPDFFGTLSSYFESCFTWSVRNKQSLINELPRTWKFRKLSMVYPCNVVSRLHLEDIGQEGLSLRNWIASNPCRGTLDQVTEWSAIWNIKTQNLESTVRQLWDSGFFPCAEHFEIVGWSGRWQLPDLRARGSVLDLLTASLLSDTKFLDGEEPAQVTAYKRKVGKA